MNASTCLEYRVGGEDDGSKGNGCIEFMFLLCEMFICEMIGKENFRKVFVVEKKENSGFREILL